MSDALILAADVGGTKTLLQLLRRDNNSAHGIVPLAEQRYQSQSFDSLEGMVEHFLQECTQERPHSACFAVAGPVSQLAHGQQSQLTNLPWQLDSQQLSTALHIPNVTLLNDFQAIGYSLDVLGAHELEPLHPRPLNEHAPRLVVGAGTGLGVCLVTPDGDSYRSFPTEGGHLAFAPLDIQQESLYYFLRDKHLRVSYERLLSGAGLVNIYRFLLHNMPYEDEALLHAEDPAAAIGRHALEGKHPAATEAVQLFMRIYGAFAGDMALACLPQGGLYIAGGIAPKLLPLMQNGEFMQAFRHKGRMQAVMETIPVQIITNPACGLLGAARYAARY